MVRTLTSIKPCKMKLPKCGLYNYVDRYFSGAILLGKILRVHYGNYVPQILCTVLYGRHAELETNIARMTEEVYM